MSRNEILKRTTKTNTKTKLSSVLFLSTILLSTMSVAALAAKSGLSDTIKAQGKKGVESIEGIVEELPEILPKVRVIPAEAEFKGVRVRESSTECESDKSLYADSEECQVTSRRVYYEGSISGFVDGTWKATGKSINDRRTRMGYVSGQMYIYDEAGTLVYKGKLEGAKELLPTITEITEEESTEAVELTEAETGVYPETTVYPFPHIWSIEGSMNLVGRGKMHRGRRAFLNFDAKMTNLVGSSAVEGTMDGVIMFRNLMPWHLPALEAELPTTTTTTNVV